MFEIHNGVQSNGVTGDISKILPYVDVNSGTKNRIVTRDPISGLGNLPAECSVIPGSCKTKIPRPVKGFKSRIIDHSSPTRQERPSRSMRRYERNPLTSKGVGPTVDDLLKIRARSRNRDYEDPVRDPISGLGDFKTEWDPIYLYESKPRRAKSVTTMNRNPIVNDTIETVVATPRKAKDPRNPITGQNVKTYNLSIEDKNQANSPKRDFRNVVTGENCDHYVVTMETDKHSKPRTNRPVSGNPLSGENCNTFMYIKEEKNLRSKHFVYSNPVTGENRPSYVVIQGERPIRTRTISEPCNPLSGENVPTYDLYPKQIKRSPKLSARSNPLTGENIRSLDEHSGYISWRAVTNSARNAITGQNCDTYSINTELRSERSLCNSLAPSRSRSYSNLFFPDDM